MLSNVETVLSWKSLSKLCFENPNLRHYGTGRVKLCEELRERVKDLQTATKVRVGTSLTLA